MSQAKLIAEPWDVGEGGYQVGEFPPLGRSGTASTGTRCATSGVVTGRVPDLASRLTGSCDLHETSGRLPVASVNFVTCHDGFTLRDSSVREEAQRGQRRRTRDGTDDNRSYNCGAEGPTDDPEINEPRARQARNFLVTLFCSQGAIRDWSR